MLQRYLLELNGKMVGRLFGYTGGMVRTELMRESAGFTKLVKQPTIPEEIVLTCGTGMARAFYHWITSTFDRLNQRHHGAIHTLDDNQKPVARLDFQDALITSVTFPTLQRSNSREAYLVVTLRPERVSFLKSGSAGDWGVYTSSVPRAWQISGFKLDIEGLEAECQRVKHIRSFTVRQGTKVQSVGNERRLQVEPTSLEYPNLSLEIGAPFADGFVKWHDAVVRSNHSIKNGTVDYFAPGSSLPYFSIRMKGLSPFAYSKQSDRTNVDLSFEGLSFDAKSAAIK